LSQYRMVRHGQRKHEDVKKDHQSILDTCAAPLAGHCLRLALLCDPQVADRSQIGGGLRSIP
jgi:hypothetical protein